jgi:hypothetical protein
MLKAAILVLALGVAPALAYDGSWYRSNGWGGEYPNGFTMTGDTAVEMRGEADPAAPAATACLLRKDATYHQWNEARVASDKLEFVTFSRIEKYRLKKNFTADVQADKDGSDVKLRLKKGDAWEFLTYIGEGFFLMRYRGAVYQAGQDLAEASDPLAGSDAHAVDEWLKLTCANGATGWLLFADTQDKPGFGPPNITDYGHAADGQPAAQE